MKKLICIFIITIFNSCNSQNEVDKSIVNFKKVNEITMINKVDCIYRNYSKETIVIKNEDEIKKVLTTFEFMSPVEKVNSDTKNNNGFLEVIFFEGEKEFYFNIVYTLYNGVVIIDLKTGNRYKNDKFEIAVYKHFTD